MQATRQRILDYLRQQGRATVKELDAYLGITSPGVRQHLTVLEREGLLEAHEERGHVGRPAHVYRLTEKGDGLDPQKSAQLANVLLDEMRELAGTQPLQTLLRRAAMRFAEPYQARLQGKSLSERVAEAMQIIRERGSEVDCKRGGEDWLIRQFSCPFPEVAQQNSGVCALDVEFVRQLVGTDARLSTSLLRGDLACTYRIRSGQAASPHKR